MNSKRKQKILELLQNILCKKMETYSISSKKNTANKNSSVRKIKHDRLIFFIKLCCL